MSYDSSNLTTPDIKWLGVRPSDLDRFNIPEQCRLPMTEEDMKTGKRLVCALYRMSLAVGHQMSVTLQYVLAFTGLQFVHLLLVQCLHVEHASLVFAMCCQGEQALLQNKIMLCLSTVPKGA